MAYIAEKNLEKCRHCGFCDEIACGSRYVGYYEECTGYGACSLACPYEAIQMIEIQDGKSIYINGNLPDCQRSYRAGIMTEMIKGEKLT